MTDTDAVALASVLKAVADPVRLRLLSIIAASGEACACDLPEQGGRSQATVSHHLSQLTAVGLLRREQRGKWAWFQVDDGRLAALATSLSAR